VLSLNGSPEQNSVVEAVGIGHEHSEEAITNASGVYRLRGLRPDVEYNLRLQIHDRAGATSGTQSSIERTSPASIAVEMSTQDQHGLDFVVFRRPTVVSISGVVNAPKHLQQSLTVVVFKYGKESSGVSLRTKQMGSLSPYFEFGHLPRGTYTVRLETTMSLRDYTFQFASETIALEDVSVGHVVLSFNATMRKVATDVELSSMTVLLFLVVAAVCILYHREVRLPTHIHTPIVIGGSNLYHLLSLRVMCRATVYGALHQPQ
jgi:hypothetical protein